VVYRHRGWNYCTTSTHLVSEYTPHTDMTVHTPHTDMTVHTAMLILMCTAGLEPLPFDDGNTSGNTFGFARAAIRVGDMKLLLGASGYIGRSNPSTIGWAVPPGYTPPPNRRCPAIATPTTVAHARWSCSTIYHAIPRSGATSQKTYHRWSSVSWPACETTTEQQCPCASQRHRLHL
jgi:hypothetical protein